MKKEEKKISKKRRLPHRSFRFETELWEKIVQRAAKNKRTLLAEVSLILEVALEDQEKKDKEFFKENKK